MVRINIRKENRIVQNLKKGLLAIPVAMLVVLTAVFAGAAPAHAAVKNGLVKTKFKSSIGKTDYKYSYYNKGKKLTSSWKTVKVKTKKYKFYFGKSGTAYKASIPFDESCNVKVYTIGKSRYGFNTSSHLVSGGIYVDVSNRIWAFTAAGKVDENKTRKLRTQFQPYSKTKYKSTTLYNDLVAAFGKPAKVVVNDACNPWNLTDDFNGVQMLYKYFEIQLARNNTTKEYAISGFYGLVKTAEKKKAASTVKPVSGTVSKQKAAAGKWEKKDGYLYYIVKNKKLKGLKTINDRTYYFDSSGIQRTGWRLLNGKYCYFQIKNGKNGYMVQKTKVNGVSINKKGEASVTDSVRNKLSLMVQYQELADRLVRPGWSKEKRLVTVFKFARDKSYRSIGSPPAVGRWDEEFAEAFLHQDWADCVIASCGFGYLANAVGAANVSLRLYGHGHCEIEKRIYDPGFAKTVTDSEYTRFYNRKYEDLPAWGTGPDIPIRFI